MESYSTTKDASDIISKDSSEIIAESAPAENILSGDRQRRVLAQQRRTHARRPDEPFFDSLLRYNRAEGARLQSFFVVFAGLCGRGLFQQRLGQHLGKRVFHACKQRGHRAAKPALLRRDARRQHAGDIQPRRA